MLIKNEQRSGLAMTDLPKSLERSLERVYQAADRLSSSVNPNEEIKGLDYENLKSKAKFIRPTISQISRDKLIESVTRIIAEIELPKLEAEVAARGQLVVGIRVLDLVNCLQMVTIEARKAGLFDPDAPNIDLAAPVTKKDLAEINKALEEVHRNVESIDRIVKENRQSGVGLTLGFISVDIGTLLGFVSNSTEDVRSYLFENAAVNTSILQSKLKHLALVSKTFLEAVVDNTKELGRKVVNLSVALAKAANNSYLSGLRLIKRSFETRLPTDEVKPVQSGMRHVVEDMIDTISGKNLRPSEVEAFALIHCILKEIRSQRKVYRDFVEESEIVDFKLLTSHSANYVGFYFSNKKYGGSEDVLTSRRPERITFGLKSEDFRLLKQISRHRLTVMANKALFEIRNEFVTG